MKMETVTQTMEHIEFCVVFSLVVFILFPRLFGFVQFGLVICPSFGSILFSMLICRTVEHCLFIPAVFHIFFFFALYSMNECDTTTVMLDARCCLSFLCEKHFVVYQNKKQTVLCIPRMGRSLICLKILTTKNSSKWKQTKNPAKNISI